MIKWKEWKLENLKEEVDSDIIWVKFADGIIGLPDTVTNWKNTVYNVSKITHYRTVSNNNE